MLVPLESAPAFPFPFVLAAFLAILSVGAFGESKQKKDQKTSPDSPASSRGPRRIIGGTHWEGRGALPDIEQESKAS